MSQIASWDPRSYNPQKDSENKEEENVLKVIEDALQVRSLVEKQGEPVTQCAGRTFTIVSYKKLG